LSDEYDSIEKILDSRYDMYDKVLDLLGNQEAGSEAEKILTEINNKLTDIC